MNEYVADEYEGTRPVPDEPGHVGDAPAKDKAIQPEQDVRQQLGQSPACERKR